MRRDYIKGSYDSETLTLENVGSGILKLELDGMLSFAFADLEIFSDSGLTIPLNPGAFEVVDKDDDLTTEESDTINGGSGKTVYVSFRILDPTHQTGFIYIKVNNFGAYTNGTLVGVDYIIMPDADYAYEIKKNIKTVVIDSSNITTSRTLTITKEDGCNIRNKVEILNGSTSRLIITDTVKTYWCEPGETFKVYYVLTSLLRSLGYGLVYDVPGNTASVADGSLLDGVVLSGEKYEILGQISNDTYKGSMIIDDVTRRCKSESMFHGSDQSFVRDGGTTSNFRNLNGVFTIGIVKIWKWYTGLK